MVLHGNVPKRLWHFAIAHAAYIHNVTSPSRLDKSKTIFELVTQEQADKQDSSDSDAQSDDDDDKSTCISSRQKRPPADLKARPENPNAERKANLLKQYNSDKDYSDDRNSILDIAITKHFPGHGSFDGKITEYHRASDNYSITYQDGISEVMSHSNVLKYIRGSKQYEDYHENQKALYSAFHTAVSSTTSQSDNKPENHKDA